ncbi:MAG: hypothetical protein QOG68_583 [Solirubrobacteraceae bacterium]|nr:hypothetical protein [Solirubrobacteraceae bacterium]
MRRGTLVGAVIGVVVAMPAATAQADQSAPTWNCRSTVFALFGSTPQPRLEPLVANGDGTTGGDRPACADDREGLPAVDSPAGSPLGVHVQGAFAATSLTPAIAAARDQTAYAGTKAADVSVGTTDGQLTVTATAVRAEAAASCVDGVPKLDGSSTVVDLAVNGQALPVSDDLISQITSQIDGSPLGGVLKVLVNQKVVTADSLTVQAVRVELLSALGTPQATVVLGEAKVAKQGDTCASAATEPPGGGGGGTTTPPGGGGGTGGGGAGGTTGGGGSTTTGSGTTPAGVKPVIINGRHGGCGRVSAYIDKVTMLDKLPGTPRHATLAFGQRAVIRGRLVNCKGRPIEGAKLDQLHVIGHGFGTHTKTGLKSRSNGRFTLILQSNMSTRDVVIAYRGNLASSRITSKVKLHFRVVNRRGKVLYGKPPRGPE